MLPVYHFLIFASILLASTSAFSLPTSADASQRTQPSRTDSALPRLLGSVLPVETKIYPDWAGQFNPDDCEHALRLVHGRLEHIDPDKQWIFWSRRWVPEPVGDSWELPFGWKHRKQT